MAEILWARHGENVANLTRTFSYRVFDGDLTGTGRQQAANLARRLADGAGEPVGLLACSPLRRARQTAEIVGHRLGLAVALELEDLREVNVGELDGRSDEEAWDTYARVIAAWKAGETEVRFPGGEDCAELCARLRRALAAAARSAGDRRSLLVAHGANLRAALPGLAGRAGPGCGPADWRSGRAASRPGQPPIPPGAAAGLARRQPRFMIHGTHPAPQRAGPGGASSYLACSKVMSLFARLLEKVSARDQEKMAPSRLPQPTR